MKRILVDLGSVVDLLYLLCLGYKPDNLRNPGRVLVDFNGSQTNSLGEYSTTDLGRTGHRLGPTHSN